MTDIKLPGIELAGYWEYFTPERIQVLGKTKITFLNGLTDTTRRERLRKFYDYPLPGVIITRNFLPPDEMILIANESKIPLLRVNVSTTRFLSQL